MCRFRHLPYNYGNITAGVFTKCKTQQEKQLHAPPSYGLLIIGMAQRVIKYIAKVMCVHVHVHVLSHV